MNTLLIILHGVLLKILIYIFLIQEKNFAFKPKCRNDQQLDMMLEQLLNKEIAVQVIIEGYQVLYQELENKLTLSKNYFLISADKKHPHLNASGIIVNTDIFTVLHSAVITKKYMEDDLYKELAIPYVFLSINIIIFAVHVNGCKSQYPQAGLETLAEIINELKASYPNTTLIGIGDFNTQPENIIKSVISNVASSHILVADFPTHVNPFNQVVNYDNIIIIAESISGYHLLRKEFLSEPSQTLVETIESSQKVKS